MIGRGFWLLRTLEINIDPHHGVKVREFCTVNQNGGLDRGKRRVRDPSFKIVDLHGFLEGVHVILGKSGITIVLVNVGSAELVKREILTITTVVQSLEGQKNIGDHGVHLVPPKEMIVEGTPRLASILLVSKLLDMLPRA